MVTFRMVCRTSVRTLRDSSVIIIIITIIRSLLGSFLQLSRIMPESKKRRQAMYALKKRCMQFLDIPAGCNKVVASVLTMLARRVATAFSVDELALYMDNGTLPDRIDQDFVQAAWDNLREGGANASKVVVDCGSRGPLKRWEIRSMARDLFMCDNKEALKAIVRKRGYPAGRFAATWRHEAIGQFKRLAPSKYEELVARVRSGSSRARDRSTGLFERTSSSAADDPMDNLKLEDLGPRPPPSTPKKGAKTGMLRMGKGFVDTMRAELASEPMTTTKRKLLTDLYVKASKTAGFNLRGARRWLGKKNVSKRAFFNENVCKKRGREF